MLSIDNLHQHVTTDDGCLPNGRAARVDEPAWSAFLSALHRSGWRVTWAGEPIEDWPQGVADVVREDSTALRVEPTDGVAINIFPSWGADSIWFDFDIREMRTQDDADALYAFIRLLGQSVGRIVELSYEGFDEMIFASYDPATDSVLWSAESE